MNKTSQLPLKLQGMIKLVSLILLLVFLQKKDHRPEKMIRCRSRLCVTTIFIKTLAGHSPAYSIGIAQFKRHLKMLHDSGYNSILPSQLTPFLLQAPVFLQTNHRYNGGRKEPVCVDRPGDQSTDRLGFGN